MKIQLFTIAIAALSLYSCGPTQNTTTMDDTTSDLGITESYWKLETLEGKDILSSQDNEREIGFTLNESENRISGYAGCNNFFGTYTLKAGNQIDFSALGATKMACPDGTFNESKFLKVFNLADNYRITGDKLELNIGKRAPLAVFKRVVNSEPIVNKYWKLKTLEGKEVKMLENQEKEIYFTLKPEENRVAGFAGCNALMGSYTLETGNRILFSNMASTMMACPDVDINDRDFLKVFELVDNYTVNEDELSLSVGKDAPLAVFEAVYFD
ncbi:META domain-containing protein [Aequorivita marina]|uniref:META domain-containing protein n=1 Tax=Aequorivita marina TaxID=3073654 RepID=UPI002877016B|nr:META domain-containing protein [Aequorivita sp. S2608]MDS1299470.1 META domain-containing protein [Aequorivita sp. S2608]